jgi:hypothetical protein
MGLIYKFYTAEAGLTLPREFEGLTIKNFLAEAERNPRRVDRTLVRCIMSLGRRVVREEKRLRYDLLLLRSRMSGALTPAIYLGRQQAMLSNMARGVEVVPVGRWFRIVLTRRLIDG